MPDSGRAPADQPDLEAVARTERLLDAIAQRRPVESGDPGDEVPAALLEEWRDELRWPPASGLVSDGEAVAALRSGATAPRRTRPGLAVAATVLCLGGFGAVVAGGHPGDALYGLHTVLFGEPEVTDEQIALAAKTELDKVQQMIVRGQWDQAQDKLASPTLRTGRILSAMAQQYNNGPTAHSGVSGHTRSHRRGAPVARTCPECHASLVLCGSHFRCRPVDKPAPSAAEPAPTGRWHPGPRHRRRAPDRWPRRCIGRRPAPRRF